MDQTYVNAAPSPEQLAQRARQTQAAPQPHSFRQPQPQQHAAPMPEERPISFSQQRAMEERGEIIPPPIAPQSSQAYQAAPGAMNAAANPNASREEIFQLDVPVQDASGFMWTHLTLRRPKWGQFEEYLGHQLVRTNKLSANSAMIAACAGVPLDFMLELDMFDGMKLMERVQGFFPQALLAKFQPDTPQ